MKQILQDLYRGNTALMDVPQPALKAGHILIKTNTTLLSAGTERMLVTFGKANLLNKARQQPARVAEVFDKIKTDGLVSTWQAVSHTLHQPIPLGYCHVGTVLKVAEDVTHIKPGQRVLSNANHAEVVVVPKNLCVAIPDAVLDESAVFGVLGAIALQGIRLAALEMGECVAVFGLGLIGLLTVQLLRAQGCRVLGLDMNEERLLLAHNMGAQVFNLSEAADPFAIAQAFSRNRGMDAVLITATTDSSEPVHLAAQMSRKRGRIILVGVTGLELSRKDFYEKELSFQVSCSYGPGRYDAAYEEGGQDYPLAYVRFTEQRNFETVLDLLERGALNVAPLITHRMAFIDAEKAYEVLMQDTRALGILLQYPEHCDAAATLICQPNSMEKSAASVAFIGAGHYAQRTLIPAFQKAGALLHTVCARSGALLPLLAKWYGFYQISTDVEAVIASPEISTVVIVTQHDSHAALVIKALCAGKNVFVEKPLALNMFELSDIVDTIAALQKPPLLMVGFNRRFSPYTQKMKRLLDTLAPLPKAITMTINAGPGIKGGERILGELCHFVDLARYLAGHPITSVKASALQGANDTVSVIMAFEDGSIANLNYFTNGHRRVAKERIDVFCGSRTISIDNYRVLKTFGFGKIPRYKAFLQDKGQKACVLAFMRVVKEGGVSPIPLCELQEVVRATCDIHQQCLGA